MKGKVFCNFNIYKIFFCFVLTIELYLYINYYINFIWRRSVFVYDKFFFIEVVVIFMRNKIKI